MQKSYIAHSVFVVPPTGFRCNEQTKESNAYQHEGKDNLIEKRAINEWNGLVTLLQENGIKTNICYSPSSENTPDGCFPNNWVSIHPESNKIVFYPMCAPNRRLERTKEAVDKIKALHPGYEVIDLSSRVEQGRFLEGTGSLVIDRNKKFAIMCASVRSHQALAKEWAAALEYELFVFDAVGPKGIPVYHTNVIFAFGETFCVGCFESITDPAKREELIAILSNRLDKQVIPISVSQVEQFCGNILQLQRTTDQTLILCMSTRSYEAFTPAQREALSRHGEIVHTAIPTIEDIGGGGVRCLLAEMFE